MMRFQSKSRKEQAKRILLGMAIQEEIKMPICQISCLLLMLIFVTPKAQSLRITSIEVPPAVMNSSQVTLICNYDLQGDQLYSVKWYKNYVEFYRFQPSEQAPTTTTSTTTFGSPVGMFAAADNQAHSKHEFELDGINLNLAGSNSTHVYLRQTSLASEGTYKCEVSADSPSFATISSERQMKVYVLPRQKLSIVDNSLSTIATSLGQQQAATLAMKSAPTNGASGSILALQTYNMNDLVNLTCVSGPSRPAAKLSWLLNDSPIPSSSKWLTAPTSQQLEQQATHSSKLLNQQSEQQQQLIESRLTIAFRTQSNHLATRTPGERGDRQFQPMKLRCVARLSVEFVSETSIVVSGGKTTLLKKRQQQQQQASSSSLPTPSSLQLGGGQRVDSSADQSSSSTRSGQSPTSNVVGASYSVYRWPHLASGAYRALAMPSRRQPGITMAGGDSFVDAWITSPATLSPFTAGADGRNQEQQDTPAAGGAAQANGLTELSASGEFLPSSSVPARSIRPARQHQVVIWTQRQMRDQAEHIDQLLRLARSNQLDTPLIEAKTQLESIEKARFDLHGHFQLDEDRDDDATPTTSYYDQLDSTEADGGNPTAETVSWEGSTVEASTVQPPSSPFSFDARSASGSSQDYELNDLVQFTCNSRVAPAESEVNKAIHLKWFINNQEIPIQHVNAFDGTKFYYAREPALPTTKQPTISRQRQTLSYHRHHQRQSLPSLVKDSSQPSESISNHSEDFGGTNNISISGLVDDRSITDQNYTLANFNGFSFEQKSRSLWIEFTPSLFQSKELNLKCKTLVEQPLIEYDSQLVASVALSPFIQVDSTIRHQRPGIHLNRNNQNQQQQNRQHGRLYTNNQRNRNGSIRPQQSSSSSSSESFNNSLGLPFLSLSGANLTVLLIVGSQLVLSSLLTNQLVVINAKLTTFQGSNKRKL